MKQSLKAISVILIALSIASCGGPQGEKAVTGDAKEVSASTGDVTMQVDPAASKVEWTGSKPTGSHHGTVKISDGKLILADGKLTGGKFTIDMTSIMDEDLSSEEDNAKLVGHLKSPDFFDVAKFPEAVFVITSAEPTSGSPEANYNITGNLTLKDITKSVIFPANVSVEGDNIRAVTPEFIIDRTDWDVRFGSKKFFDNLKDKFINDEIGLRIELNAGM